MRMKGLAALAAFTLVTAPVAASAAQIASAVRSAGAETGSSSELDRRGIGIYIIGAVVLGLIIWGIIELTGDDDAFPTSP